MCRCVAKFSPKSVSYEPNFLRFEFGAVQKGANIVDLEKCCKTHTFIIYSQKSASTQPRTSTPKIFKFCECCANFANFVNVANLQFAILEPRHVTLREIALSNSRHVSERKAVRRIAHTSTSMRTRMATRWLSCIEESRHCKL